MPTVNPRVNVTLSPSLDHLVTQLAGLERCSKSQVLRELLEAAEPGLQRAVTMMHAATNAMLGSKENLQRQLLAAAEKSEGAMKDALRAVESAQLDLVEQAQAVGGRRPARRAAEPRPAPASVVGENPPISNRGVKSVKERSAARSSRGVK
jgi:hypothetical protein